MLNIEKTRIVVMGCGGSGGVPYAGNVWKDCDPTNPKNRRTRPSIFVERGDTRIVIDTGPDFRNQINATGLTGGIDAIFYSHYHADHVSGIDDIRAFYFLRGQKAIDIYACASTAQALTTRFDYIFRQSSPKYPPTAIMNVFEFGKTVTINQNLPIQLIKQTHGLIDCAGFRMGDFAYTPDVSHLDEVALYSLMGI
jgi:phosphoribosyl 1,2-cyclic phosphate phosphodiesterase